jgi:hypothetical protein
MENNRNIKNSDSLAGSALLPEIRDLIHESRNCVAVFVNATLTKLY